MWHIIKGIAFCLLFCAIASALAATTYGLLGVKSWWWPMYWPALLFFGIGFPILFLLDHFSVVNQFFSIFFPEGGASGIFGAILMTSFVIWSVIFSIATWKLSDRNISHK